MTENVSISTEILLKFDGVSRILNKLALVQVMARHWAGDKPLPEPMTTLFTDAYFLYQATMC